MSVFTTVSHDELVVWLQDYPLGVLQSLQGIAAGIENTNYFVSTSTGEYVLTLFEKLTIAELPYYLNLMAHLSAHGIPCPAPVPNHQGALFGVLNGKPASLVTRLEGKGENAPNREQCAQLGATLAAMHVAGTSYPAHMPNPRGADWWTATQASIAPFMPPDEILLLQTEIAAQAMHRAAYDALPQGVIHADLFRDNALMVGERVGGLIDFYFACHDSLAYDVAITVNDWCVNEDGSLDADKAHALLAAYHGVRPFTPEEASAWPWLLRAAALRFWTSRLFDWHLPRAGEMTHAKDPSHFKRVLVWHHDHASPWLG